VTESDPWVRGTDPYQNVTDPQHYLIGYLFNMNCLILISYLQIFELSTLQGLLTPIPDACTVHIKAVIG
jgi:hypothetical protein